MDETMVRPGGICGVISRSGPHGEPLACGYAAGHLGDHAWASLPSFVPSASPFGQQAGYQDGRYSHGRVQVPVDAPKADPR